MSSLSKNWHSLKIDEICHTTSGGTPTRSRLDYYNGSIPWLKSGELNDNPNISRSKEYISEKGLNNSNAKLFNEGTLLLAMYGATVGKAGILSFKASTNQAICAMVFSRNVFNKFLFWFFIFYRDELIKKSFGGAQPNLSQTIIRKIQIPLPFKNNKPDLKEQKRIADKIDKLFTEIDKGIEKTKMALANTEKLFKSELKNLIGKKAIKVDEKKLLNFIEISNGNSFKSVKYKKSGIPLVRIGNINNKQVNLVDCKFLPNFYKDKYKDFVIKNGDLLIALSGATTGKIGWYKNKEWALLNQRAGNIKIIRKNLNKNFIYYYFLSDYCQEQIIELSKGAAQPNLTATMTKQMKIKIPLKDDEIDCKEQEKIVGKLDVVYEQLKNLQKKYEKQLKNFEMLKQSILNQAFQGKL